MSDVGEWASSMENTYKFPMGDVGNCGEGGGGRGGGGGGVENELKL